MINFQGPECTDYITAIISDTFTNLIIYFPVLKYSRDVILQRSCIVITWYLKCLETLAMETKLPSIKYTVKDTYECCWYCDVHRSIVTVHFYAVANCLSTAVRTPCKLQVELCYL